MCRACRTARLDMLVSTRSTRRPCRDVTSKVEFRLYCTVVLALCLRERRTIKLHDHDDNATEKGDERNFPEHEIRSPMSVSHYYRAFKHGLTDAMSSALLPTSIISSLIDVIHSSLTKLRNPTICQQLAIKTVKFSNSFIPHRLDRYR